MTLPPRPLVPHPIAMEFPDIDCETFKDLKESMRTKGFDENHPIVLYEGMILDGRNRQRCVDDINSRAKSGERIEAKYREFMGTREEAIAFSIRENLLRRHLTLGQRALIGDGLAGLEQGGDRRSADYRNQTANLQSHSVQVAAEKVHVAPRSLHNARKLRELSPTLAKAVLNGKATLNGALTKAKKAAAPKMPPRPAPKLDEEKRAIHPNAAEALGDGRAAFKALINKFSALRREAVEMVKGPLGRLVHLQSIETDFENIGRLLRFGAPYTSCPLGDPCPVSCKLCRGTQWIGEQQWAGVPKKIKTLSETAA